ncbi:uncharacterized protein LOC107484751 [Arachis duranensis]|uniref:Uncharacterized protein LOC107484751 n=1 Tax=Arachis duranensis TaxID=130453 RepID=A0A6P4D4G6_ARADU|nr:uncharacterized protein LOC107484751 [Arachis duranensis]
MASEESFVVLVHHRGSIKWKTRSGVKFTDKDPLYVIVRPTTRYEDLVSSVLLKLGLEGVKRVKKFFYRIPITVLQETVKYDCFTIGSDDDLQVMFHCRRQFPEVRTPELLAKLVDAVSSSGGSNRNTTTLATVAGSSSRPAVASSSVPAYEPPLQPVVSPSFAVDLNGSVGDEVGEGEYLRTSLQCLVSAEVGDGFLDDPEEDDVEPDMIADDSGNDVGASEPAGAGGGSSSGTQQYPPHFSSLDLAAMRQEGYLGSRLDLALEMLKSLQLSLRQRKGVWEVKRYNGPHTCPATSISSDHRKLDYHVISAFIMPMVRADASVSIKVLLNATATHFGFRPTYRRVWLAKQKAVALIYGDWDESYNELPRLFWTFPPCIEAFRHCKPLISIDGTHLYGKYGGTLLVAIAQDGNSNILPVAFTLVKGENAESWHNGIKAALEAPDGGWLPPSAYWAFCIRHVVANFALTFKGKDARRLLVNAAFAKTEVDFHYWFDILRSEDPTMCDWANRIE